MKTEKILSASLFVILALTFTNCGEQTEKDMAVELTNRTLEFVKSDEGKTMFSTLDDSTKFINKIEEIAIEVGFKSAEDADVAIKKYQDEPEVKNTIEEIKNIIKYLQNSNYS